ncbi:MAG: MFS transporter [Oscillospiraceae bacterium]|jgi:Na+/melibiose symporter-like transporter|nr:MFS transporter [Oscillospiraceae bacterium]
MAKKSAVAEKAAPPKGRRYVGPRETVGFVLYDVAQSVNVSNRNQEFTDRILNISRFVQAAVTPFATAWDIINDLFVAAMVDKTRTRFGKFRPYLVLYPLYGIPVSMLFYVLPYLFLNQQDDPRFLLKIIVWALVTMFNELTGTISGIARTGMIANITPDPQDRLGLINKANFFSMFGEDLPKQVFAILQDIIANNKSLSLTSINTKMRKLYLYFGVGTIAIAGALSLYFAFISKERVFGTEQGDEKPPTIRESMRGLRNNRPLFMLMISEILGGFSIKGQLGTYTDSILNFRNFGLLTGIPGSPVSYLSYAYVPWLRERFSTKTIWLVSSHFTAPTSILIFFFGMIHSKKDNKRLFLKLAPMMVVYMIENTFHMALYGASKVIPEEIRNECIDYGEWKNGFRAEGMTGALRSMPSKITNAVGNSLTSVILGAIGFKTGKEYNKQNERTAMGVFALATIIPTVTSILGIIPKFFYNISQDDREQMYAELKSRRAAVAQQMARATDEAAESAAQ